MRKSVVGLFRFLGIILWTVAGFCAGGVAGGTICERLVIADVTKRLPPPRDATGPMVLIFALAGAILGAICAQVFVRFLLARFFPFSAED
jgi:hypothetical protein